MPDSWRDCRKFENMLIQTEASSHARKKCETKDVPMARDAANTYMSSRLSNMAQSYSQITKEI